MKNLLEIMTVKNEEDSRIGVRIGIRVKIGEHETIHPVSGICNSPEALDREIDSIKENIEDIRETSRHILEGSSGPAGIELRSDMEPEEIWKILSSVHEEAVFLESFNRMDEAKRKEVADYILTRCNIFTGKGALFSSRYDHESGLLE